MNFDFRSTRSFLRSTQICIPEAHMQLGETGLQLHHICSSTVYTTKSIKSTNSILQHKNNCSFNQSCKHCFPSLSFFFTRHQCWDGCKLTTRNYILDTVPTHASKYHIPYYIFFFEISKLSEEGKQFFTVLSTHFFFI